MNQAESLKEIHKLLMNYDFSGYIERLQVIPASVNQVWTAQIGDEKVLIKKYLALKEAQLLKFHKNIIHLQKLGVPSPKVFANNQGEFLSKLESGYYDVSEFIKHETVDEANLSTTIIERGAKAIAGLHKLLKSKGEEFDIDSIDYYSIITTVESLVEEFMDKYEQLASSLSKPTEKQKLDNIRQFLIITQKNRNPENFSFLTNVQQPTHGDVSSINILFTQNKHFFIDWDYFMNRPVIWDLVASMSLFSMSKYMNGFLVKPDYSKMKLFLNKYLEINRLTSNHLRQLPEVVNYNFAVHWLTYTLPPILRGDFRLLDLATEDLDEMLYWQRHLEEFRQFLNNWI